MTEPYYSDESVTLYHGDNREVLKHLDANSLDACVTDPPYELGFMGRKWDASGIAYDKYLWAEVWRVLKPGGHLLAFGGTRTWHRLACAIEDAGFEVRDSIAWMYGSGFPKSLDVSKAIDKANGRKFEDRYALGRHIKLRRIKCGLTHANVNEWFGYRDGCQHWERQDASGARVPTLADYAVLKDRLGLSNEFDELVNRIEAEREVVGKRDGAEFVFAPGESRTAERLTLDITAPATPAAQQWQGWGTALKPAHEPIVVARKPLTGTVAENVQQWGTGALNIDGCRIVGEPDRASGWSKSGSKAGPNTSMSGDNYDREPKPDHSAGRWPANVILDESQSAELDRQSGDRPTSKPGQVVRGRHPDEYASESIGAETRPAGSVMIAYGDSGGASRFFYTAKADSSERPRVDGVAHPTVKPLDLMRYLVRLVTPPGGTVLEPFAGSGTTLEACIVEGFSVIGIELTEDYLPLIMQRLSKPIEVTLL